MFVDQKEELRKIVFEMEEVLGAIDAILTEKNPRKAVDLLHDLRLHVDGYGNIPFGRGTDFYWEDFLGALDTHDRWRQSLQADGLLEPYMLMGEKLREALSNHVARNALSVGDFLQANLEYDPANLAIKQLSVTSGKAVGKDAEIKAPGKVLMARDVSEWAPRKVKQVDYAIDGVWWNVMRYVVEVRYPDPDYS
jgi:hypothetical protein